MSERILHLPFVLTFKSESYETYLKIKVKNSCDCSNVYGKSSSVIDYSSSGSSF